MIDNYSVLMSVYYKEQSDYLRESMLSIYNQSVPTNDFVLICDGPLTEELYSVIEEMNDLFCDTLHVYRLEKNSGLGNALNEGLKYCKNELVARMDSDDISRPERCEKQLMLFRGDPEIKLASGTISEFELDPTHSIGLRILPLNNSDIIKFSKKRNPMNHPCVMFKKSAVESVGGYKETFHLFEDYYLWVRMLMKGYKAINVDEILLDMRSPMDIYLRRGGIEYAKEMLRFHQWMKSEGWSSTLDFFVGAIPHAIVCVLPVGLRKRIYQKLRN